MLRATKTIVLFFCLFTAVASNSQNANSQNIRGSNSQSTTGFPRDAVSEKSAIYFKVIKSVESTYGYDIYVDGKLLIHQSSKPGIPGVKGFATEATAAKAAELVISKLRRGVLPPSVSREELKTIE